MKGGGYSMPRARKSCSEFGVYLAGAIKAAGMSQYEFYTQAEVAKPYFYEIMAGKTNPPPRETLERMLYCTQMHYAQVNPVFVVQVQPGTGKKVSDTNLDDVLAAIEDRLGMKFALSLCRLHCLRSFSDGYCPLVVE